MGSCTTARRTCICQCASLRQLCLPSPTYSLYITTRRRYNDECDKDHVMGFGVGDLCVCVCLCWGVGTTTVQQLNFTHVAKLALTHQSYATSVQAKIGTLTHKITPYDLPYKKQQANKQQHAFPARISWSTIKELSSCFENRTLSWNN